MHQTCGGYPKLLPADHSQSPIKVPKDPELAADAQ
jgi:hypothetical protein